MSKNYEFIPANELPMAESENVNILCVENGELKLKTHIDIKNLPVTESDCIDILCMENGELKRKSVKPEEEVYDLDIEVTGTWNNVEEMFYWKHTIHSRSSFSVMKEKILNFVPMKYKALFKCQAYEASENSPYAVETFIGDLPVTLMPEGFSDDNPEFIIIEPYLNSFGMELHISNSDVIEYTEFWGF